MDEKELVMLVAAFFPPNICFGKDVRENSFTYVV